jgi:flagellar motor switch/type III secretory pathway protein FliN
MPPHCRPLVLLPARKLQHLEAMLQQALTQWAGQWALPVADFSLHCQAANHEQAALRWQSTWGNGTQLAWASWQHSLSARLQHAMFGTDAPNANIAQEAASQALQQWLPCLMQVAGLTRQPSDSNRSDACLAWASGAIHVRISLSGQAALDLLFEHRSLEPCWSSLPAGPVGPALPPLVARSQALGRQSVRLQVHAGQAGVSVGNLLSLAVGDVIRFNHPVDAPLPVQSASGQVLFDGFLGLRDAHMALELVPHQPLV